jgi:hypothetical protein
MARSHTQIGHFHQVKWHVAFKPYLDRMQPTIVQSFLVPYVLEKRNFLVISPPGTNEMLFISLLLTPLFWCSFSRQREVSWLSPTIAETPHQRQHVPEMRVDPALMSHCGS